MRGNAPQLAIADVDWGAAARAPLGALPSVFAALSGSAGSTAREDARGLPSLAQILAETPEADVRAALVERLRGLAATALGVDDPRRLDPDQPLQDLGLDSILAVELRNVIGRSLATSPPATLLFDHPTIERLAAFCLGARRPAAAPKAEAEPLAADGGGDGLLDMIEGLDDEDVDARLAALGVDA